MSVYKEMEHSDSEMVILYGSWLKVQFPLTIRNGSESDGQLAEEIAEELPYDLQRNLF